MKLGAPAYFIALSLTAYFLGQLESHAEEVPVFVFKLAPCEGGVLVLLAGEVIE